MDDLDLPALDLLRRIGADTPTDDDALARVRARLLTQATPDTPSSPAAGGTTAHRSRPRPGRAWRFGLAAGLAAVLGAGGVLAGTWSPDERPPAASANAATFLNAAAEASLRTSDPTLGPNQYLKVTTTALWSTEDGSTGAAWLDKEVITTWVPADPATPWVMHRTGRVPHQALNDAGAKEMTNPPAPPQEETLRGVDGRFYQDDPTALGGSDVGPTWGAPTPAWLATLPRDVDALHQRLVADAGDAGASPAAEEFVLITDVLRSGIVPADLRAALYQVAATKIPGIELLDTGTTLQGRTGVAVGLDSPNGLRQEMVFDPETGQVIGEQMTLIEGGPGLPAGTVLTLTEVSTEVVDSAP